MAGSGLSLHRIYGEHHRANPERSGDYGDDNYDDDDD